MLHAASLPSGSVSVVKSPKRFGDHQNAFGFLRFLLASLVIVSHAPELSDGDRSHELLTGLFHTLSFGELAVDGFFVISGFLICGSFLNSSSPASYLRKRVARIYPGFVFASLICVFFVGPLAGGHFLHGWTRGALAALIRAAVLCQPAMADVFSGTPYPLLNGAAWTIQYEFLCYVLICILGTLRVLGSALFVGFISLASLLIYAYPPFIVLRLLDIIPLHDFVLQGHRIEVFRLCGLFFAGSTFYLMQSRVPLSKVWAGVAFIALCAGLFIAPFVNLAFAIFGGYLLFSVATLFSNTVIAKINNRNDISYGVYLYAWPICKLLLWWRLSDNPIVLGVITWLLAATAGALSWFVIEKPFMRLARRRALRN